MREAYLRDKIRELEKENYELKMKINKLIEKLAKKNKEIEKLSKEVKACKGVNTKIVKRKGL